MTSTQQDHGTQDTQQGQGTQDTQQGQVIQDILAPGDPGLSGNTTPKTQDD